MAHKTFDRAQETSTGTGLDSLPLLGATPRMFSFASRGAVVGDTFWGLIEHIALNEIEITLCTVADGAISRAATPVLSSNDGAKVSFSAGIKTISNVAPAQKQVIADKDGNFLFPGKLLTNGVRESVATPAIVAGVLTLDLAGSDFFRVANTGNVTSVALANAVAGYACAFLIDVIADGTARAWSGFPWTWLTGSPIWSVGLDKRDRLVVMTTDGVNFEAAMIAQNF